MASSMKSFVDFVQKYTPQLLALMCAIVLLALRAFQRSLGGNKVYDKQAGIMEPHLYFRSRFDSAKHRPSNGALYVTENALLALFLLWCLKPFADLAWEILLPVRHLLKPYFKIEKRKKSKGILESGGYAAYGSCLGTSPDGENALQSENPGIPASHVQEPMLTWQYLHPQGAAYNEGWCLWLEGAAVSTDALRTAFRNIIERHPSFRTKFTLNGDSSWTQEAIQVHQIFPHIFSQVDAMADERLALRLAQEALSTPLKIFSGMSSRVGVIRVSSCKVLVYVVQHHVCTDGVSMPLLHDALRKQYMLTLQPPNRGLALFASSFQPLGTCTAECSTSLACKEGVKESLEWWRKQLEGVRKLDLPTDYVRKPQPTFNCIHVPIQFPPELSNGIQALAQSEGVTVFDVLLALHSTWLCKMAGQEDVIVWTAHHGRSAEQAEAVGCFRTDMPLRLVPCGTFRQLLHIASQVKRDGLNHCHVPTMPLLEIAGVDAKGGQNVLNYYSDRYSKAGIVSAAAKASFADGVQACPVEFPKQSAIPDVEVTLSKDAHGCLHGHAVFSSDIFSQSTAECMLKYFTTMAMTAVSDASCDVSELPLLTPNQEKALDDLHGSAVELRPTVVELLARCLKTAPDSVAIEYEPTGEQLTYAELGARIHGLAAHLSTHGIGCDVLCALMLDRSIEMIVAIYSVWWAGGAYVPIEPSATEKYLDFIVEDLRVHNGKANNAAPALTLLTQSWILQRRALQKYFSNTLSLDSFKPRMPDMCPCRVPECGFPEGNHLCYSIYTSGSTGRPKGVLLQHQGLANYIEETRLAQGITSEDVIMQKTPYIFDVSLFEFASPLTVGAKLLIAEHEAHKDVTYVANAICRSGVTVTRFVPSYLDIFLDHLKTADAGKSMPLRSVGCSGEAMHTPTCLNFLQLLPQAELYDLYGPTEGTVEVTSLPCTGKALRSGKTIGKPLGGCQIYVGNFSDYEGQGRWKRTPVGLHGELLIGGVQVGRGYLNLPEKTAKAFIENPFSNGSDIVYRTGDVVKWRADGQVVYIGRADNQVKLSGVRIELGEIETAVAKVPGVREGVVKMLKDAPGGASRLVAYVAPASAASDKVTKYCREVLPHYMVPSVCVGIDEWPRTASGKIDLKQLPVPPVYGEEAENQEASFAFLSAKIQSLGLVGAMGDDEVQQHGWNSFQLMTLHAEMMRNPQKFNGQMSGSATSAEKDASKHDELDNETARVQVGVISIIGHIWLAMMVIVLLEWLVAYWEWYHAMPAASSFNLSDYPVIERLNALGRFLGDPVFTLLSGIQDMTDAQAGKTGNLFRRTLVFMGICVVFTHIDRLLLQGPFVRNGWIDASWALDTSRVCGVLNGSSFVFVRACFIPFPLLFSMGRISWIKIFGIVEWPWVCLICSMLLPALLKGLPQIHGGNFGDGSWMNYIQASNNFICELSPYYFMYPLFIGGIRFPRPIATWKVRSSTRMCCAITTVAAVAFSTVWKLTEIENVSEVNYINSEHVRWNTWLNKVKQVDSWPLLDQMSTSFDLWAAFLLACFLLSFAAMMPVTPSPFSLMGTRVIACYLTMPLTLGLAGHYIAPGYLYISGPWRASCGAVGVIATLLLIVSVTTAQNVLPEWLLKWVSDLGPLMKGKCSNSRA